MPIRNDPADTTQRTMHSTGPRRPVPRTACVVVIHGEGLGRRADIGDEPVLVGRSQEIEIGPLSGRSNVLYWLERRGIDADEELVDRVFRLAKASRTVLTEQEVLREIEIARGYSTTRLDA